MLIRPSVKEPLKKVYAQTLDTLIATPIVMIGHKRPEDSFVEVKIFSSWGSKQFCNMRFKQAQNKCLQCDRSEGDRAEMEGIADEAI